MEFVIDFRAFTFEAHVIEDLTCDEFLVEIFYKNFVSQLILKMEC